MMQLCYYEICVTVAEYIGAYIVLTTILDLLYFNSLVWCHTHSCEYRV